MTEATSRNTTSLLVLQPNRQQKPLLSLEQNAKSATAFHAEETVSKVTKNGGLSVTISHVSWRSIPGGRTIRRVAIFNRTHLHSNKTVPHVVRPRTSAARSPIKFPSGPNTKHPRLVRNRFKVGQDFTVPPAPRSAHLRLICPDGISALFSIPIDASRDRTEPKAYRGHFVITSPLAVSFGHGRD